MPLFGIGVINDVVRDVGHSFVIQIWCQSLVNISVTAGPPYLISSLATLSIICDCHSLGNLVPFQLLTSVFATVVQSQTYDCRFGIYRKPD